jgi:hypothetical protein
MALYSQFEACSTDYLAIRPEAFRILEHANENVFISNTMSTVIMITNLVLLVMVSIFWLVTCLNKGKEKKHDDDFKKTQPTPLANLDHQVLMGYSPPEKQTPMLDQPEVYEFALHFTNFTDSTDSDIWRATNNCVSPVISRRVIELHCKVSWND